MSRDYSPHYFKKVPEGVTHLDIYSVLKLFEVSDPAVQHAVKKLLCAGQRGAKDREKDLSEAIVSINRALELANEFEEL